MNGFLPKCPSLSRSSWFLAAVACLAFCWLGLPASALAAAPSALTIISYSTNTTTATVEGLVNPGELSTHYQADYGLSSSEWCSSGGSSGTPEHATAPQTLGSTAASFSLVEGSLSALSQGTKYCVEIVAENSAGTGHGGQVSFTAGAPTAITLEPLSVTSTTVLMAGALDGASQSTHYRLDVSPASSEWCTTHGAAGTPQHSGESHELTPTDGAIHNVVIGLAGLESGRSYCDELIAENPTGVAHGGQVTFTAGAPAAETRSATSTGATTARIEGEVDPASQTTYYRVDYAPASSSWCATEGASGAPEVQSAPTQLGFADEAFHAVTANLSGLHPNTAYCAELVAENGSGTARGFQVTFTTARAPVAVTLSALATGTATATLQGEVDPEGQTARYDVEYAPKSSEWCQTGGVSGARSVSEPEVTLPNTDSAFHPVKVELHGLEPGTEYCAALVAIGASSALPGKQVGFTTTAVHTLTVTLAGSGSGTVTGSGISCPFGCSAGYEVGMHVTLTATPGQGSAFAGWGGACSGAGPCEVTVSADQHVTATFTAITAGTGPGTPSGSSPTPVTSQGLPVASQGPPSCSIRSEGSAVRVSRAKTKKGKSTKPTTGSLAFAASCDQGASVKLVGLLTDTPAKKGRGPKKPKHFTLTSSGASVSAGKPKVLNVKLPTSALADLRNKAKETVTVTLTATNGNGTGKVKVTVAVSGLRIA